MGFEWSGVSSESAPALGGDGGKFVFGGFRRVMGMGCRGRAVVFGVERCVRGARAGRGRRGAGGEGRGWVVGMDGGGLGGVLVGGGKGVEGWLGDVRWES